MRYDRQSGLLDRGDLGSATAAVVGLGGLGCPAATYLALAGIGRLVLIDSDTVEESNLNRQFLYQEGDVGRKKVEAAAERLAELNPTVGLEVAEAFDADALGVADVVLDCLDNWGSRRRLWELAFSLGKPVIHGAAGGWSGQVAVFRSPADAEPFQTKKGQAGQIVGAAAGEVGSRMALEALKLMQGQETAALVSYDRGEAKEFPAGKEGWTHVLVRFSEIWLKSPPTRRKLLRRLSDNIRGATGAEPEFTRTRLLLPYSDRSVKGLPRVFGVASFSPALRVGLDDLGAEFENFARRHVRNRPFRVSVRRAWKGHPKTSMELERELGALADRYGPVDLENYEVELGVELYEGHAYLFTGRMPGPGGLPYGSEGRVLALFSGGIDSPVAAWMAARRGAEVVPVFLNPLGEVLEAQVHRVFTTLAPWLPGARLQVADVSPEVEQIRTRVEEGTRQTVYKRFIYRVAEGLARELGCEGIVTGENLGQVSSQTLRSLAVIDRAVEFPVFRPLLGMDKEEISARAREIGTFGESSSMAEFCSLEGHSNAHPSPGGVLREEARLDFDPGEVVSRARPAEPTEVPDLQPPEGSLDRLSVICMWEGTPELEPGRSYLFVCRQGQRAAEAANRARGEGLEAYAMSYGEARKAGLL